MMMMMLGVLGVLGYFECCYFELFFSLSLGWVVFFCSSLGSLGLLFIYTTVVVSSSPTTNAKKAFFPFYQTSIYDTIQKVIYIIVIISSIIYTI